MKFGLEIVNFMHTNSKKITGIEPNDHPTKGFLKFTLKDGTTKIFDQWDEEDQGLFACTISNKPWDPSIRGITSLEIISNSEKLTVTKDDNQNVIVNEKPVEEWGEKVHSKPNSTLFSKKPAPKETSDNNFCGLTKGFLG
jgi:hypothetical protein